MTWTDERVAELKRLWAEGHSASQIGQRLRITRNAVIGKVHRMGLPTRKTAISSRAPVQSKPRSPRKNRPRVIRLRKPAAPRPARVPPAPIPDPLMIDLMSKSDSQCSFPKGHVGEPGFGFCGHPATHGSYCAGHHRLTHIPLAPVNMFGIAA